MRFIVMLFLISLSQALLSSEPPAVTRSAKDGPWSSAETWEGGKLPVTGSRVQVRAGHTVIYDLESNDVIRSIHLGGTLRFATDKNTLLNVGLIKIQPGDDASESGFDCTAHIPAPDASTPGAALEVGSFEKPIDANRHALIRLHFIDGMDRDSAPAIVCCGGRMDFHGATLNRTWVKLGEPVKARDDRVTLAEAVSGWRAGDRIILTATQRQNKVEKTFKKSVRDGSQTEERIVAAIDGLTLKLDKPAEFAHRCEGEFRGEAANLSRNVVVESAAPDGVRGHTMFHKYSSGSIGYAEFRHLGKPGVLGRYSLHYHLVGDTMRGSSVVGASIWDSGNRWLTIHGTNYLVVKDCVGYRSAGHGFFMEDGTEVYNVLDRNLAVDAFEGAPLPKQILPYDRNDGSGFWWANSLNTFTRNVAVECDEYGYFFQATTAHDFDVKLRIRQPDGTKKETDIRTLPFVRFDDNEAHCMRRHTFNLGGAHAELVRDPKQGCDGVGPDAHHPFVIRNFKVWEVHWAFHVVSPSVLVDGLTVYDSEYGLWRSHYAGHAYRAVKLDKIKVKPEFEPVGTRPVEADFPKPLEVVDDLPPATVITQATIKGAKVYVTGVTSDNGTVKRVRVNGADAKATAPNFSEWEAVVELIPGDQTRIEAFAEDAAGNVEKTAAERLVGEPCKACRVP